MSVQVVCAACGTVDSPKSQARGSFAVELVLWLCFIIPGLIYSVWRLSSKRKVCRACGSSDLVPMKSPRGRKLAAEFAPSK